MGALDGWADELDYPITKSELIEAAVDAGAPQDLVERLQRLEAEQYDSADALERELADSE